ncbi:ATP-dependent helicase [Actimicrobium sp. CCC2.4]|uniref:ATP-dependent helicase n=1 Tax=Actimicrobium sp. CCC2.4 TaxID=3048606 RepID=UPI002AC99C43|nr:ATP-dependent helicase [Actimicrobium sp. CCC2.4]MEB0135949.1 ATP-dependent helicase [Actimicrobium sp. CCC2.4]WPX32613.1 ATP-dependent helicase [Actimicrobium sp. CCC2.4]
MSVTPTPEQIAIIESTRPVTMIEAVAGAGKTTVLACVLKRACEKGIASPQAIALCFSQGAKERLAQKCVEEGAPRGIVIQTVEEFARQQVLNMAGASYLDMPVFYDSSEQIRPHIVAAAEAVWQRYADAGVRTDFDFSFDSNERVEDFIRLLVRLKAGLVTLEFEARDTDEIAGSLDESPEIIAICQEIERQRGAGTGECAWQSPFDHATDLIGLFRRQPEAIEVLPRFRICVVDEWHDVNAAEFALVQLLARHARLVVVGDRDQIINADRGADPALSSNGFDFAFPGATRQAITRTFRFGSSVSTLAAAMMRRDCVSQPGLSTKVTHLPYQGGPENDCAAAVIATITAARERKVVKLSDFAIVVRDADQSIEIENQLIDAGMPYRCSGFDSYLVRPEILMLRGLLHIATGSYVTLVGDKPTCEKLVRSLGLYASARFDSDVDFASLLAFDERLSPELKNERRWQEALRMITAEPATLESFFSGILCRVASVDSASTGRWKIRFAGVVETLRTMARTGTAVQLLMTAARQLDLVSATSRVFVSRGRAESATRSIDAFIRFAGNRPDQSAFDFLAELATRQASISKKLNYLKGRAQLDLTTVQYAKGKEWPQVLIPYLERGQFPRTANLGEERRLLYVAMTRAMTALTLFEPAGQPSTLLVRA